MCPELEGGRVFGGSEAQGAPYDEGGGSPVLVGGGGGGPGCPAKFCPGNACPEATCPEDDSSRDGGCTVPDPPKNEWYYDRITTNLLKKPYIVRSQKMISCYTKAL